MVLPPRWGNNTVCVWSSLQQFLFLVFFPSHWVIQLWGFPFFLYFYFFHTLLFWVLRLYFNFLEIIWLDTKKKKKRPQGEIFVSPIPAHFWPRTSLLGVVLLFHRSQQLLLSHRLSRGYLHLESFLYYWCALVPAEHSSVRVINIQDKLVLYMPCVWGRWYSWSVQEELWKASLLNLCHMLNHQTCLFIFKKRSLH